MKTALYARVSTNDKGQNVESQLHSLREFCKARGWTIAQTYTDTGVSGSKERRPELDKLMKDAAKRKFDCVLVFRLDRFRRSSRRTLFIPPQDCQLTQVTPQAIRDRTCLITLSVRKRDTARKAVSLFFAPTRPHLRSQDC